MAVNGCVWLCRAMYGYVGLCMAVYGCVGLCRAMLGYVGLCKAIERNVFHILANGEPLYDAYTTYLPKSSNCMVDNRWVLKIADYGLPTFRDKQAKIYPSEHAYYRGKCEVLDRNHE